MAVYVKESIVYVKGSIPTRVLTSFSIPADPQIIVVEFNLRKEKWFFVGIYKPPSFSQYFLDTLSDLLDFYSNHYPSVKYMFVEYSWNIPIRYSQYIRKKFPMKFLGIFRNNVPGILNTGIFPVIVP